MVQIKAYLEFSAKDKAALLAHFIDGASVITFETTKEMEASIKSLFNNGRGYFGLFHKEELKAGIGVIVKDIPKKQTAYLACIASCSPCPPGFEGLLLRAVQYAKRYNPEIIKLGISSYHSFLTTIVKESGFHQTDEALILKHSGKLDTPQNISPLSLETLQHANAEEFMRISNAAFLNSPNGSMLSREEVSALINGDRSAIAGLALYNGETIGIYETKTKDSEGWLETMAIHPDFQNRRLGTSLLYSVLKQLFIKHASVKLLVMDTNFRAKNLYLKNGFTVEKTASIWFEQKK